MDSLSHAAKKEGTCQAFMSPVMLLGGQPKRHLRPSRSKCVFIKEKKITGSLPKHLSRLLSFPGSLSLALTLEQLMWGWGVGPTPKDRRESPKQLYFSKGPGCRCHGTNVSGHHTTVYTTVGTWSQIVGRMWPEASSGKSASSTPHRSEDLLPAAQTGPWRL